MASVEDDRDFDQLDQQAEDKNNHYLVDINGDEQDL